MESHPFSTSYIAFWVVDFLFSSIIGFVQMKVEARINPEKNPPRGKVMPNGRPVFITNTADEYAPKHMNPTCPNENSPIVRIVLKLIVNRE